MRQDFSIYTHSHYRLVNTQYFSPVEPLLREVTEYIDVETKHIIRFSLVGGKVWMASAERCWNAPKHAQLRVFPP